jgi:hypothetical protein
VTFKDLQKVVQSQSNDQDFTIDLQSRLQNKPFWIFNQEEHKQEYIRTNGQCCFWHILKPPTKDGHDMPVLPYQKTLYEALQQHKHLFIKKPRGLGVTFLLRYIAWCCTDCESHLCYHCSR